MRTLLTILLLILTGCSREKQLPVGDFDGAMKMENNEEHRAAVEKQREAERVTMEEYLAIETGMTIEEVVAIAGEPHEELSRGKIADIETAMFKWTNEGRGSMLITFQNDKVVTKAQHGLE